MDIDNECESGWYQILPTSFCGKRASARAGRAKACAKSETLWLYYSSRTACQAHLDLYPVYRDDNNRVSLRPIVFPFKAKGKKARCFLSCGVSQSSTVSTSPTRLCTRKNTTQKKVFRNITIYIPGKGLGTSCIVCAPAVTTAGSKDEIKSTSIPSRILPNPNSNSKQANNSNGRLGKKGKKRKGETQI